MSDRSVELAVEDRILLDKLAVKSNEVTFQSKINLYFFQNLLFIKPCFDQRGHNKVIHHI